MIIVIAHLTTLANEGHVCRTGTEHELCSSHSHACRERAHARGQACVYRV